MKVVQLIGTCYLNIWKTPAPVAGVERWCANDPRTYVRVGFPAALKTWTRWFNVHSPEHIAKRHPRFMKWAVEQSGEKPIYTRDSTKEIPGNLVFPGPMLQEYFKLSNGEVEQYFTHQAAWLVALALYEGFGRIELWGYQFGAGTTGPVTDHKYAWERPNISYWVGRARERGVEVVLPPESELCQTKFLYGYEGPPL